MKGLPVKSPPGSAPRRPKQGSLLGRRVRSPSLWLALATSALLLGCATVMMEPPTGAEDPWGQRALARLLEAGLDRARPDLAGNVVRVVVRSPDPAISDYAAALAGEEVRAAGGTVLPRAPYTLRMDISAAGRDRTERSLVLPAGQYIRVPLYYGQDDAGEIRARLTLVGPNGEKSWDLSAVRRGRTAYAFRILGPFGERQE